MMRENYFSQMIDELNNIVTKGLVFELKNENC
jgi:hypothetical protein